MNITQIKEACRYFTNREDARQFYNQLLRLPIVGGVANLGVYGNSSIGCLAPLGAIADGVITGAGNASANHLL